MSGREQNRQRQHWPEPAEEPDEEPSEPWDAEPDEGEEE